MSPHRIEKPSEDAPPAVQAAYAVKVAEATRGVLHAVAVRLRIGMVVMGAVVIVGLVAGKVLYNAIQDSRRDNTFDSCVATNGRHERAIDKTLILVAPQLKAAKTPEARARLVSVAGDLVDAFTPRQAGRDLVARPDETPAALRVRQATLDRAACRRYADDRV